MRSTITETEGAAQRHVAPSPRLTLSLLAGVLTGIAGVGATLLAQGRIEVVGHSTFDCGTYPAWENRTARFTIKNAGSEPLRILALRGTCGCGALTTDRTKLSPGETTGLLAEILPNALEGAFTKHVFVETTDKARPLLQLTLTGRATPLLTVTPRRGIDLGRLRLNQPWECRFALTSVMRPVKVATPNLVLPPGVTATLVPEAGVDARLHELRLHGCPSQSPGEMRAIIEIFVTDPTNHPPIRLEATGRIGDELVALPAIVRLGARIGSGGERRTFVLRLMGTRSRRLMPADVTVSAPDGVTLDIGAGRDPQEVTVTALFMPGLVAKLDQGKTVVLRFEVAGASPALLTCRRREHP